MGDADDLHWLCCWGGDPLAVWEDLWLLSSDRAELVDYWLWKEAFQLRLAKTHSQDETTTFCLHMYVRELRAWSDRARQFGLPYSLPP